jgi:uncharacterized damage-inducible protein DinB
MFKEGNGRMEELIREYANGYDLLRQAVEGVSEEEMVFKPAADKWSIREILVHLADAEIVGLHRMKKVLSEQEPMLTGYDQDAWAGALRYGEQDAEQHLQLFKLLRESFLPTLRGLRDEDWKRIGIHTEAGPLAFEQLLQRYVNHVRDHLKQIERVREAYRAQGSGKA